MAEFIHWHKSGVDFLLVAAFYPDQGNAPIAPLLLDQACVQFYQCVLWSVSLHGPRTHALDEPREARFERRAFVCIRRAHAEARYR